MGRRFTGKFPSDSFGVLDFKHASVMTGRIGGQVLYVNTMSGVEERLGMGQKELVCEEIS